MAPQLSSLRTSFRALCITRIEIKESVIYTEGDRGSSSRKARISLRLNRRVRWMRRTVGSLEKSISITRLTLAVSSAETRRAEGTATALAVLCSTAQLCRCSRLCCSGLTRGQKRQYNRDGNQSQNVPPKMPNMLGIGDRLNSHNHAVHDTRPDREPD